MGTGGRSTRSRPSEVHRELLADVVLGRRGGVPDGHPGGGEAARSWPGRRAVEGCEALRAFAPHRNWVRATEAVAGVGGEVGDVIYWDSRLLHNSIANVTDTETAKLLWYIVP